MISVALKKTLKNKIGNLYLHNFTSASTGWIYWFHTKLSSHILQQNCAHGCGNAVLPPIKRNTAPNSSNKVSIRRQEFLHWIFLSQCRLLISSADLRVTNTSMRSQPCFNLVQKSVGTPFSV